MISCTCPSFQRDATVSSTWYLPRGFLRSSHEEDSRQASRRKNDDDLNRQQSVHAKALFIHQLLVERIEEGKQQTVVPFVKACQERVTAIGGFPMSDSERSLNSHVVQEFQLSTSRGPYPVKVIDNVLSNEWCQKLIDFTEAIGYGRVPSLQDIRYQNHPDQYLSDRLNTSKLVQIESQEFADYLWRHVESHLPQYQKSLHVEGLIKPLSCLGSPNSVYEKRGIIPVFRFMRYQPGQGFKAHFDPIRYYSKYPIDTDKQGQSAEYGQVGIFRSIFTLALYLNDPSEFVGGQLDFVKERNDKIIANKPSEQYTGTARGDDNYISLETVLPAVGRCAIFRHDELHEGGGVEDGTKYMIQCDVLYECTSLNV